MKDQPKRVFISYSHDSVNHQAQVLALANQLRIHGIDAELDQYHSAPPEGWPRWCEQGLRPENADYVLMICTPEYLARVNGKVPADEGRGVYWEGGIIFSYIFDNKVNGRFLPLLLNDAGDDCIPQPLRGHTRFHLGAFTLDDPGYQALYRLLTGQPRVVKPKLGEQVDLPIGQPALPPQPARSHFAPPEPRIARSRLLDLGVADRFDDLLGRERELERLDQAWADPGQRIVVLVADGGVGKTSLAAEWLMGWIARDWHGPDGRTLAGFFDWSFYSQGTRDQAGAHSGQFMDTALRHFGLAGLADSPAPAEDKAEALSQALAVGPSLLLLDGLEPLQHPPRPRALEGRLKDPGLERLLKRLAQAPRTGGLCLVTTRVPLVDLKRFHPSPQRPGPVHEIELKRLSPPACAQLLHQAGARRAGAAAIGPTDTELLAAARELQGHPLAAQLLGGYLRHAQSGDIRRRDRVDWQQAWEEEQEGHAASVLLAYQRWFEQQGPAGECQLAVLRLLGLFDRPAEAGCLTALRAEPPIPGLTEPLVGLSPEAWAQTLNSLAEDHRLLSRSGLQAGAQVDAHPLLRFWFAARLRAEAPEAWTQGHRRLFEHLSAATEHRPASFAGLQPLYQAVAHGCQAGLHQQALYEVFINRVLRGTGPDGVYSTKKLGAMGADLGALAWLFERPWDRPAPELRPYARAWVLAEAGFRLRALGRLGEAQEPMLAGLGLAVEQETWENAAIYGGNLSELELALGDLAAARSHAEQALAHAEASGSPFRCMSLRSTLANTLHQAGDPAAARARFAAAEAWQTEHRPLYPRLYSLAGFEYCDLLLAGAEVAAWCRWLDLGAPPESLGPLARVCGEVVERAQETLTWAEHYNESLLSIALDRLSLARAVLYSALLQAAPDAAIPPKATREHLEAAVAGLRQAGTMNHLPRVLLTRAWLSRLAGSPQEARIDLDEAWDLAERGPMPLFQADILLHRARLFATGPRQPASYPWGHPRTDLGEARRLVHHHGYHRRDRELADAEAAIL